jgi:poly-gamma-glutamate capsule biosynthesis protein CapA/YwtB (metallophosphatase superfamily)
VKFKSFLILFVIVILGLGGGYFYQKGKKQSPNGISNLLPLETTPTPNNEYTSKKTTYFAVVTGIKNKKNNINSEEFGALNTVYILKDVPNFFTTISSAGNRTTTLETVDELVKTLNASPESIGMIPIENLTFKVKTLSVNNIFPLDKTADLDKYPFKLFDEVKSKTQVADNSNLEKTKLTKLGHTGSMISGRGVQYWVEKKFNNDYTRIFKPTKPLFDTFDYLSSTFEAPVIGNGKPCDSCFVLVGPDKFMEGVKYSGIDFFTLADNHIMDGGVEALANTQKKLDELNIKYTGASTKNNDDAGKPVLVEVNGLKIAYLGFNDTPGLETWARDNKPGAASISDPVLNEKGETTGLKPNEERIKFFLQRAKDLKPDLILVLMHWNHQEYKAQPLDYTRNLAKLITENGADMILGDHPHWVQEIEFRGEKPVFYSMGNFIFDQMWSMETRQGMSVELNFYEKKLVNFKLHPHQLDLYEKGTVELLKPEQPEYQQVIDRVMNVSKFD